MNIKLSGSVWSSLLYDTFRKEGDKEGFLLGEIIQNETTNISDSQITKTTQEWTVSVISHVLCPKPFSFYNRKGQIDQVKLLALLKEDYKNVVGWFRYRPNSITELSVRESCLHHNLLAALPGVSHQRFIFGLFSETVSWNHTTITCTSNFFTYDFGKFLPKSLAVENLGDTAESEYKLKLSPSSEKRGSDSYRMILSNYRNQVVDKDGCLMGMQGIKRTNQAVQDRLKSLKQAVVESEESLGKLVQEVQSLYQRMKKQSHDQKSPSEGITVTNHAADENVMTMDAESFQQSKNEVNNKSSTENNVGESIDEGGGGAVDVEMHEANDPDNKDPFSGLIIDMKASIKISSPAATKKRSDSDGATKYGVQNERRKNINEISSSEKVRECRSSSDGDKVDWDEHLRQTFEADNSDESKSKASSKVTSSREPMEDTWNEDSDSTQLFESQSGLELSSSQTF